MNTEDARKVIEEARKCVYIFSSTTEICRVTAVTDLAAELLDEVEPGPSAYPHGDFSCINNNGKDCHVESPLETDSYKNTCMGVGHCENGYHIQQEHLDTLKSQLAAKDKEIAGLKAELSGYSNITRTGVERLGILTCDLCDYAGRAKGFYDTTTCLSCYNQSSAGG